MSKVSLGARKIETKAEHNPYRGLLLLQVLHFFPQLDTRLLELLITLLLLGAESSLLGAKR